MTTDEKLDLLLTKVIAFDNVLNEFKQEMDEFKQEMNGFERKLDGLEQEVNELRQEVKHNSIITENIVNKCIQTMGEGIQLNAERFDRLDIDSVRLKAEQALLIAQLAHEKVNKLTA